MKIPSPKEVFENPSSHWDFLVQGSDDDFEGQHFDRKEAGRENIDGKGLRTVRNQIVETISAFANARTLPIAQEVSVWFLFLTRRTEFARLLSGRRRPGPETDLRTFR